MAKYTLLDMRRAAATNNGIIHRHQCHRQGRGKRKTKGEERWWRLIRCFIHQAELRDGAAFIHSSERIYRESLSLSVKHLHGIRFSGANWRKTLWQPRAPSDGTTPQCICWAIKTNHACRIILTQDTCLSLYVLYIVGCWQRLISEIPARFSTRDEHLSFLFSFKLEKDLLIGSLNVK